LKEVPNIACKSSHCFSCSCWLHSLTLLLIQCYELICLSRTVSKIKQSSQLLCDKIQYLCEIPTSTQKVYAAPHLVPLISSIENIMPLTKQQEIILAIAAYSFCSGTLVLLNKLTLHFLPFPSLVVSFQLLACIVIIYAMQCLGYIHVDAIQWEYVKPYMLYIFFFATGVYCNMRSLSTSNVETVIVFRALSPSIVAFLDVMCLGREWPTQRSWFGLCTLVVGAYGYASFDEKFQVRRKMKNLLGFPDNKLQRYARLIFFLRPCCSSHSS
jgi:Triose-phosphate Transporter family